VPTLSSLLVFAGAALVLLIVPGPAVVYITTRSVAQGRAAGLTSVLGIHTGSMVHVAAAALGLSALLVSSATTFHTVKYAGAAYLVWLGVQSLRRRTHDDDGADPDLKTRSLRSVYLQGVFVNILNPKTALFFLAFLPQFVDPARGSVALQALVFGLLFILLGIVTDGAYALASAALGERLRRRARATKRAAGVVYVGLGLLLAKEQFTSASNS